MLSPPIRKPSAPAPPVPVLRRKGECGAAARSPGPCPACDAERLQPRLAIGAVDDPLEREADRMADAALAGRAADFSRIPVTLQRRAPAAAPAANEAPPSVHRALAEPGRPLDPALRRDLEPRFGHDFSQVRVHDGAAASESARAIGASAYTVADHIVFRPGRYAPATPDGRRLLAHELAHVAQQRESDRPMLARRLDPAMTGSSSGADDIPAPAPGASVPTVTFGGIAFQGSANRIPPTRSVDVLVTVSGLDSGAVVAVDVEGSDPANGMALITEGAELTGSGKVTVKGRAQTMPGNAGTLRLRASLGGTALARSEGFTVAAYPFNFADINFKDVTNEYVVGITVEDSWKSDGSGLIDELDQVHILELVDVERKDAPFKAKESLVSPPFKANKLSNDDHFYPKGKIDATGLGFGVWEVVFRQLSLFSCARTGQTDLVMPNSGFRITHRVSRLSPRDALVHTMSKVGAAVVVEGRSATAGECNIVTGEHIL